MPSPDPSPSQKRPQGLALTLLVITYNEAANIAACLESVPFATEKIVVDAESTDDTAAIAGEHGARVVRQAWLGYGQQRNFAASLAGTDWLLFLDADERLSEPLAAEIAAGFAELARDPRAVGLLPRATHFMGRPMRWYRPMRREYKARLYHRAHARWSQPRVHESLRYEGPGVRFRGELLHRHDPTLAHVQWKALRYAELKALDWRDRERALAPWAWPAVFAGVFLKDYLLRLAILDGARGWAAAYLDAHYTLYKRLRYYDMQQVPEHTPKAAELLGVKEAERG